MLLAVSFDTRLSEHPAWSELSQFVGFPVGKFIENCVLQFSHFAIAVVTIVFKTVIRGDRHRRQAD